jgi:serine/threonine-protein kinase RsbW
MSDVAEVISLGERLRSRREELGISQAQAARELDVARTAYRLWEMEAAKPAPDRWRLIARWLGVSVATMLLAEQLIDQAESPSSVGVLDDVAWDEDGRMEPGTFFDQERSVIRRAEASGRIDEVESTQLTEVLTRIEEVTAGQRTSRWRRGSIRKELPRDDTAPALARAAVGVVAAGVPESRLEEALLLTSELVTNSVQHPTGRVDSVALQASVGSDVLRVAVADTGSGRMRPGSSKRDGGWGFTIVMEIASRWGVGRESGRNIAWFELDLPTPGA